MPTPTIPAGNLYMNATLLTGTGATVNVANGTAGQSFAPDLVWGKSRSLAYSHIIMDSIRGTGVTLFSNSTSGDYVVTNAVTSFNSNGFTYGNDNTCNTSGSTNVFWQWKAGGTAVSNTSGTITSSVSANTTSGFSVITYTGNGTLGATIGHGLGVAPQMVIVKSRSIASPNYGWQVYHSSLGATKFIVLNTTGASVTSTGMWNDTAPTSSVFTVGNDWDVNKSGTTYVAYAWSQIAGYSSFGSYTGNGSNLAPFVYTGFRPRFIMFKGNLGGNWIMYDTSRDSYNISPNALIANAADAEDTVNWPINIYSNGFQGLTGNGNVNNSGWTYIYAAFAENPFKYANAR